MNGWQRVAEAVGRVPSGVWLALLAANLVLTIATWSTARRRLRRAGERMAHPEATAGERDAALTVASLVPAGLFWGMVLAGSLHGLVAFGREVLRWQGGWEYLVPGTLDGVSVTFALLAFRAVRRQKAPDRCQRVVWGAALASATVNFAYEYSHSGHNVVAGGYLALLSLFGMIMFHEFLNQFEEGTGYLKRENPRFGLRWITWPTNTFCAAVAWRNHPPEPETPATVLAALANLDRVRTLRRAATETKVQIRHERMLAKAYRDAELAAAQAAASAARPDGDQSQCHRAEQIDSPRTSLGTGPVVANRGTRAGAEVRVPAHPATVLEWVTTWMRMCADGDLVSGPLNDEQRARRVYDLSAKQLRNIRNAATSGALRRRAEQLGVRLPLGFSDSAPASANGHKVTEAAR